MKSKVWNVNGGLDDVTVNDSLIVPRPENVPVNVTVGAGSNAKCRARSIDSSENASPSASVRVIVAGEKAEKPDGAPTELAPETLPPSGAVSY